MTLLHFARSQAYEEQAFARRVEEWRRDGVCLDGPERCECCGQRTWRKRANPDGVLVGPDCASHSLGGCRRK